MNEQSVKRRRGRPSRPDADARIDLVLTPELREAVRDAAGPIGMTAWVREAIEQRLKRDGRPRKEQQG